MALEGRLAGKFTGRIAGRWQEGSNTFLECDVMCSSFSFWRGQVPVVRLESRNGRLRKLK